MSNDSKNNKEHIFLLSISLQTEKYLIQGLPQNIYKFWA